jgi:uncharacterized protein YggE
MRKYFLTFLTLAVCAISFAQSTTSSTSQSDKSGVIRLKGKATQMVMPDIAVVYFNVNAKEKTEQETLAKLNSQTQALITRMESLGFKKEEMKLGNYQIYENYIYEGGKQKKSGYIASNSIILKFKFDKEKLSNLFGKIMGEKSENISVNFSTEVSKELQQKTSTQLVREAIKDASIRAKTIAEVADLRIVMIKEVNYQVFNFRPMPIMEKSYRMEADTDMPAPAFSNVDVQEIELSEEVEITFQVENLMK